MRSKSGIMSLDLQLIASDSYQVNVEQNLALLLAVRIICLLLVSPSQVLYLFKASWSQMRGSCFIPDFTVSVCLTSDSVGSHSEPCSSSQQVHTDIYMCVYYMCVYMWSVWIGVRSYGSGYQVLGYNRFDDLIVFLVGFSVLSSRQIPVIFFNILW